MDEPPLNVVKPNTTLPGSQYLLTNLFVTMGVLLLGWPVASRGATYSYSSANPNRINIPVSGQTSGMASPYPSTITPSGVPGMVANVSVTLFNFSHNLPGDVDIMLVGPGPNGPTNIMLMSDAGGTIPANNLQITFSNVLGATSSPYPPVSGQLSSRAYRPSNYDANGVVDTFPNTIWTAPFNTNLNVFNGANPNGPWRLFVVDDLGLTSSTGAIAGGWRLTLDTVSDPPEISGPLDQTATPGGNAVFRVQVAGTPPFGYQWWRNGQVIVPYGQGSDILVITNVQPAAAGSYFVTVTNYANPNGVRSRDARLFVNGPIGIVDPPRSQLAQPGDNVTFEVNASGTPPLRYQWTLNGAFLPNETNATLTLPKVQAQDGGAYAVVVWNDEDAVTTKPGLLRVLGATTNLELQDDYRDAKEPATGLQGVIQGDSSNATTQPGEPVLRGGGRSVWFLYQASADGIVTLSTRGSTFDTLMQVFDGTSWDRRITKDNDRAGFYTSTLQFNAKLGGIYSIQVDGFGLHGDGGLVNVSWNLQRTTDQRVPIIVEEPVAVSVKEGSSATFRVVTDSANDRFQWFFEGNGQVIAIRGATENTYTVPEAKRANVGFYWVEISNSTLQTPVVTAPVDLQIGTVPDIFAYDKFEDMILPRNTGANFGLGAGMMFAPAGGGGLDSGYISLGLGDVIGKLASSLQAKNQPADLNPCGSLFAGTIYQRVLATNTGIIQVDTVGSAIPVRLAVYQLTATPTPPLICDLSSASNGLPAMVQFDAVQGLNYSVVLAGYQATGTVSINLQMGAAPPLSPTLKYCLVASNGTAHLDMPATNWYPEPACQWLFKNVPMAGETGTTLTVANFDESKAGLYSVWMSNFLSAVTCDVAQLALAPPFLLHHSWTTNGPTVGFTITASNAAPFVIETTTSLTGPWLPVATNPDPCLILSFTNANAFIDPQRYYRASPWP